MKRRKRLIIIFSSILTVVIAAVVFCAITGLNPILFLTGTKATGSEVVDDTNLETVSKETPTDGSTPANYDAVDNFAYLYYKFLYGSNVSSTTDGVAKAKYNGMSVNQNVYDYRYNVPGYSFLDTRSTSTFVKLYTEQFFTTDKVLYREGSSSDYDKFSVKARSLNQEFNMYGYGPQYLTGYIVCPETIINQPEVTKNADGTYTSTYVLDPSVAPFYYQRKVKTSASIADYPRFESCELTYTYNDKWEVINCDINEVYSIYKMKSWILTSNHCSETFTYFEQGNVPKLDFYKNYFDMEVQKDDVTDGGQESFEMGSLDYIGTLGGLIGGKYLNLNVNVELDGKRYNALAVVNLLTYETQIKIEDTYIVYKNNKVYYKGDTAKYLDLNDVTYLISLFSGLNTSTQSLDTSSISLPNVDTESFVSGMMDDLTNGTVTHDGDYTTVDVNLHFGSIELPVYFRFYTPNDETLEFINLGTNYQYQNHDMKIDVAITQENAELVVVDDTYKHIDMAVSTSVSFDVVYNNETYIVDGILYINLQDMTASLNATVTNKSFEVQLNVLYYQENLYVVLGNNKFMLTVDEIKLLMTLIPTSTTPSLNTTNLDKDKIINQAKYYLSSLVVSLSDSIEIKYTNDVVINDITISNITLKAKLANAVAPVIEDTTNYIRLTNIMDVYEVVKNLDLNNLVINVSTSVSYEKYNVDINATYYMNSNTVVVTGVYNNKNFEITYLENVVYVSYDNNNYYLDINEFIELANSLGLNTNKTPKLNLPEIDYVNIAYTIYQNLVVSNNNGSLLVEYQDYQLSVSTANNSIILNVSNVEYNNIKLSNITANISSGLLFSNTIDQSKYNKITTIEQITIDTTVEYDGQSYTANGSVYVNLNTMEIDANVTVSNSLKDIVIRAYYKNENLYLNVNNIFVKANINDMNKSKLSLSSNNSSFDVSIINTILSYISLNSENGTTVSLTKELSAYGITVKNLSVNLQSTQEKTIIIDDSKYIDLSYILNIKDTVQNTINNNYSVQLSFTANYDSYSADVNAVVYVVNNQISVKATVVVNGQQVEVIYTNDAVYISYDNLKAMVNLNNLPLNSLTQNNNSIKLPELNYSNIIFDLLNKITTVYNDGINISLVDLVNGLSDVEINITNNPLTIAINKVSYNDIVVENINVKLNEAQAPIFELNDYVQLTTTFELSLNTNLVVSGYSIDVVANGYVNILDQEGYLTGTITALDNDINFSVVVKNNKLLVEVLGIKFVGSFDELLSLIPQTQSTSISKDNLDLSFLKNINAYSTDKIVVEIADMIISGISIKNTKATIASCDTKIVVFDDINANEIEDVVENVSNLAPAIITILNNKEAQFSFSAVYDVYTLSGVAYVDFSKQTKATAQISIVSSDINQKVYVTFVDNTIYVTVSNIKVSATIDDIKSLIPSSKAIAIDTNVDINKILSSLIVDSNNIELGLDLSDYLAQLANLVVTITTGQQTKLEANLYDISVSLQEITMSIPELDDNYVSLAYAMEIVNQVMNIKDSFKLSVQTELDYKDNLISLAGDIYYINGNISANLNVEYLDYSVNVIYDNKTIYLSYNGLKLSIKQEDILTVLAANNIPTTMPSNSINMDIIGIVAKALESVSMYFDNNIIVSVKDVLEGLSNVELSIDNNLVITSSNISYNDITVNTLKISAVECDSFDVNLSSYINIGPYLNINLSTKMGNDNIEISVDGNAYIDIINKAAQVELNVELLGNTIPVSVIVKNGTIYAQVNGINLCSNLIDFINIDYPKSETSIDLSFVQNIKYLSTDMAYIVLESLDLNGFIISDTEVSISSCDYKDITVNESLYTNDLNELIYNALDIYYQAMRVVNNKKATLQVSGTYNGIEINGVVSVDFNDDLLLKANLNVKYNDINESVVVYYDSEYIYLSFANVNVKVSKEKVVGLIPSNTNSFDIKNTNINITKILKDIIVDKNLTIINLDLSDFMSSLNDLVINITKNSLSLNMYDIKAQLIDNEDIVISGDYVDLSDMIDTGLDLYEIYKSKNLHLSLEDIKVSIDNTLINISGDVDLLLDSMSVNANIALTYKSKIYNLSVKYVNDTLYVEFAGQIISLDVKNINSFLQEALTKVSVTLGKEIKVNTNTNVSVKIPQIESIVNCLYTLSIGSNSISLDLDDIINKSLALAVSYIKISDSYSFDLDVNYNSNITASGKVLLSKGSLDKVVAPTGDIINEEKILILLDYFDAAYKLKDQKKFNLDVNTTINENGKNKMTISGSMYVELLSGKEFDAKANLEIVEYNSQGAKRAWHQVNVVVLSAKTNGQAMFYATYGNNESNKNNVIKAYSTYNGIKSLIASVMDLMDVKAVGSLTSMDTSSMYLDIENLIDSLTINSNSIMATINQEAFNKLMDDNYKMDLSLVLDNGKLSEVALNNVFVSYTNESIYTKLMNTSIVLNDNKQSITAPTSLDGYYDLSNIGSMVDAIYNNAMENSFKITGTLQLSILIYNIDVPVYAEVNVNKSGTPLIHLNMDFTNLDVLASIAIPKKMVDVYFENPYVYILRKDNGGKTYQTKITYKTFMDDAMHYITEYMLDFNDKILKIFKDSDAKGDGFVDAALCVKSVNITESDYAFTLDMGEIADNTALGNLNVEIGTQMVNTQRDEKDVTVRMLSEIKKLSFKASIADISAQNLKLSNIVETENGYVVEPVDMTSTRNYIDSFNELYQADTYYENGKETSKIKHTVTFDMSVLGNVTSQYLQNQAITAPDVEKIQLKDGKYYEIMGWYTDKSYQHEADLTSLVMGTSKMYIYAKVRDITATINIESEYLGNNTIVSYQGASIEETVNSLYGIYENDSELYIFTGFEETFDMNNITKGEYNLTAVWQKVDLAFAAKYGDTLYTLDKKSTTAFLTEDAVVENGKIGYLFDKNVLTGKYLIENYSSQFKVDLSNEALVINLHKVSEYSSYYNITYNVDYKYNNVDYKALYLPQGNSYDIASYLPNGTTDNFEINCWMANDTYYSLKDLKNVNSSLSLIAVYASKASLFTFGAVQDNGIAVSAKITASTIGNSVLIVPRYAVIDGSTYVVTNIGEGALKSNYNITTAIFNDGLVELEKDSFMNCKNLTAVYFSDSVTTVGEDAFYFDYTGSYSTKAQTAKNIRFYFTTNSQIKESNLQSWHCVSWNSLARYYEKNYGSLSSSQGDFRNAYQTYNSTILDLIVSNI